MLMVFYFMRKNLKGMAEYIGMYLVAMSGIELPMGLKIRGVGCMLSEGSSYGKTHPSYAERYNNIRH